MSLPAQYDRRQIGLFQTAILVFLALLWPTPAVAQADQGRRPNIIFILTDDQRYDALGVLDPRLRTPNMDRMAREGVHFRNAFVTTSLCSPSRASILTGRYMHHHGIVDNNDSRFPADVRLFPRALQAAGYSTAFIGKWHMGGHTDAPQPGFDHWVSFPGQGQYLPVNQLTGRRGMLNVNGRAVAQQGYLTDELNRHAIEWLRRQDRRRPFFLYLSHKAVHVQQVPADRHRLQYAETVFPPPATMADTPENYAGKPMWVRNQRNSWHGVDFPYHYPRLDFAEYRRLYYATLSAVDDGIGAIIAQLESADMLDNTLIVLMSDNGFLFGEHGLIDKRAAYEESMRVPLIAFGGPAARGREVNEIVANIDIAPTLLALAGVDPFPDFDGRSFAELLRGRTPTSPWRTSLLYEYYWEYNHPHTPTTFALRTDRYKYIQYHGVWDTEELYDLEADPRETRNLIDDPAMAGLARDMRATLFASLDPAGGVSNVPFTERRGHGAVFRWGDGSGAAEFPEAWLRQGGESDLYRHLIPSAPAPDADPGHEPH